MPAILGLMRLRQEDHRFEPSLGYMMKHVSENNKQIDYNGALKKSNSCLLASSNITLTI